MGAFMLFIAFKLLSGLLPIRPPGFGARFGEFIPRCGLELPIDRNECVRNVKIKLKFKKNQCNLTDLVHDFH